MDWGDIIFAIIGLITCIGCIFVFPAYVIIRGIVDKKKDTKELHQRIHAAIEDITADGKVNRPKGRYRPKKRKGSLIDGVTTPPKHSGYYHNPWP